MERAKREVPEEYDSSCWREDKQIGVVSQNDIVRGRGEGADACDVGFTRNSARGVGIAAVLEDGQDGGNEEGRGRKGGEAGREVGRRADAGGGWLRT